MIYEQFFNLTQRPFSLAPNPEFLFAQGQYREAMAALEYAMIHRGGFVLLTGEVGTGKTTLCKHLLNHIPDNTEVALVLHPQLDRLQLLKLICKEFAIPQEEIEAAADELALIDLLTNFLLNVYAQGGYSILVIDEAQHLDYSVLELIRLLTNIETQQDKLLQIILLGQPELQERLNQYDLRQLNQRFTARYHLKPLNSKQVSEYIEHRLNVAGCENSVFSKSALRRLASLTGGVPRLINLVADRCLMGAYALGRHNVSRNMVSEASKEVLPTKSTRNNNVQSVGFLSVKWAYAVALLLAVGGGWFLAGSSASLLSLETSLFESSTTSEPCETCWTGFMPFRLLDDHHAIQQQDRWIKASAVKNIPANKQVTASIPWTFDFPKSHTVKPGETSSTVKWVRNFLGRQGAVLGETASWELIKPEGSSSMSENYYDPLLVGQVQAFQRNNGLLVDGVIGAQTILAMFLSEKNSTSQWVAE
ncbi:AAA family ATPase [Bermanella sp. R86510]|uniref:ExeA family protein n=1 Tax=unclassified Bermanella TaxID=2627862 RepID=UPI0037C907F2